MRSIAIVAVSVLSLLAFACGGDEKPPPTAPTGGTDKTSVTPQPADSASTTPPEKAGDEPSHSQIRISDEIKKACGITDAEAHFDFDSARIQASDHAILGKLAKCFSDGPLKGRKMRLVGHTDPRGDNEYNDLLGGHRAENVKMFIGKEGLADAQMETTSRGELDATGTEESSWANDRRVDVMLGE